jgi:transposase-like protein
VVIVADFGPDVQNYADEFAHLTIPSPRHCPHCEALDRLVGHGSYPRNVVSHLQAIPIRVKRFLCAACEKTLSILPTFCLPCRHYQTATIQTVLDLRVGGRASWSAIRRRFGPSDLPTLTTCREWVAAFIQHSDAYLQQLLGQLARWQLAPGKLEVAVEELARAANPPRQLVAAVPHLVAFLRDHGVDVAEGVIRWLATLWQWGHSQELGRLV